MKPSGLYKILGEVATELEASFDLVIEEMNLGDHDLEDEIPNSTDASPDPTGGYVDAAWEQAAMVGDEVVGDTVATPDQDIADELGTAVGLEMTGFPLSFCKME